MEWRKFGLIALAGMAFVKPARAQQEIVIESRKRPVTFNVGGTLSFPVRDSAARFATGGGFQAGVAYNITQHLAVQGEYLWSRYGVDSNVLSSTGVQGSHIMQYGNLNAIVDTSPRGGLSVYFIGGPGIYYRSVTLSEVAGVGVVPYCDPWLLVCYNTPVAVSSVLGSKSSTTFGLNGGVGVTLNPFDGLLRFYLEARFHYVFGRNFDTPTGKRRSDTQYIPVSAGVRF